MKYEEREKLIGYRVKLLQQAYDSIEELKSDKKKLELEYALRMIKEEVYLESKDAIEINIMKHKKKIDSIKAELRGFGVNIKT